MPDGKNVNAARELVGVVSLLEGRAFRRFDRMHF